MTLINLSNAEAVASVLYTATDSLYDPGTPAWATARDAADEIREALEREQIITIEGAAP